MKYSIGDKVRVKSIDWYNQMLSIPNKKVWQNKLSEDYVGIWCGSQIFYKDMCVFCDKVMTIRGIVENSYYIMEEDNCEYKFTDDMLSDSIMPKFRKDDRVETHDGLYGIIEEVEYDGVRNCYQYYVSFIVDGGYYYEDQLRSYKRNMEEIDSIVPKFKVGDEIVKKDGLTNGYTVVSVGGDYYGLQLDNGMGVLSVKYQDEWELLSSGDKKIEGLVEEANKLDTDAFSDGYDQGYDDGQHDMNEWSLPDGFEFRDENDNVINASKIVLKKKKSKYPQNYEECCQYLGCDDKIKMQLIGQFARLINARNAYWKIAGEEMGLEKPWEPDWKKQDKKYIISVFEDNVIYFENETYNHNTILAFPTEEMRDAFYEVFKELIDECKELL